MLNALWLPLTFQDTALMTIAVPAATVHARARQPRFVLSVLASVTALAAMVVPPLGGWLSDALRRRGGSRRTFVAVGIAIDVAALIALSYRALAVRVCSSARGRDGRRERRALRVSGAAARIGAAPEMGRGLGRSRRDDAGRNGAGFRASPA